MQNFASIQPRTSPVKFAPSPRTDPPGQQPSETAAVVLAIPENAAADQQRSDTPAAAQAALETAAAGQLLSEDAAAAELPAHTDSEAVHTASALPSGPTLVERFDIEPFFDFSAK